MQAIHIDECIQMCAQLVFFRECKWKKEVPSANFIDELDAAMRILHKTKKSVWNGQMWIRVKWTIAESIPILSGMKSEKNITIIIKR